MKKTVLKRRKLERVPAAGSAGRLSNQVAEEALVSVRRGVHAGTSDEGGEEEESPEPKCKQSRHSFPRVRRSGKDRGKDRDDGEGGESDAGCGCCCHCRGGCGAALSDEPRISSKPRLTPAISRSVRSRNSARLVQLVIVTFKLSQRWHDTTYQHG